MRLEEITLVKKTPSGRDRLGQVTYTVAETTLLAEVIPVTRSEYFTAGQLGIAADAAFRVSVFDYDGHTALKFRGQTFRIYRTYEEDDNVELYCSLAVGMIENDIEPDPEPDDQEGDDDDN